MNPTTVVYNCPRQPFPRHRRAAAERQCVAITGTKGITPRHWPWMAKMLDRVTFSLVDPIILVWGWSDSLVDTYAMNWASHNWYTMKVFYPDEANFKPSHTTKKREEAILNEARFLVLFCKGHSDKINSLVRLAREQHKVKVKVFQF